MIGAIISGAVTQWAAAGLSRVAAQVWRALGRTPASAPRALSPWLAGSTHRWHTNPIFAATRDRVDAHSGRVAILILQFRPDASAELLRAAITHDLGECFAGDISGPVKRQIPDLSAALERLEGDALRSMGLGMPALAANDASLLRLCDWLDAYLWALVHRPDLVRSHPDWRAQLRRLQALANSLGLRRGFDAIMRGVVDGCA